MRSHIEHFRCSGKAEVALTHNNRKSDKKRVLGRLVCGALTLALVFSAHAQEPAQADAAELSTVPVSSPASQTLQPAPAPEAPAAIAPAAPAVPPPAVAARKVAEASKAVQTRSIREEDLKQLLVGKALYLRGGYQDNSLSFDEHGHIIGNPPQGSYTLSAIQIDKVRLMKHKVELEGARYGLHFVGQLAYEDPSKSVDRVRITPKKKVVRITIDREIVVKLKKVKESKADKKKEKMAKSAATDPSATTAEVSEADQLKAYIAAAPEAERPGDPGSVTTTTSPAHAAELLRDALDQIFAQGLDERMMAAMPEFWKLYYESATEKVDYRPKDPAILRQNMVDQKARLLTTFEPESNESAQANGVAGMALYHAVVGPDGKAGEIVVGRPIGFGLDENAVSAIRKASFQPAVKDGKPVAVLLDLVVQFRIFSNRTAAASPAEAGEKPAELVLPGPYSVPQP
jgi:TonB family protein